MKTVPWNLNIIMTMCKNLPLDPILSNHSIAWSCMDHWNQVPGNGLPNWSWQITKLHRTLIQRATTSFFSIPKSFSCVEQNFLRDKTKFWLGCTPSPAKIQAKNEEVQLRFSLIVTSKSQKFSNFSTPFLCRNKMWKQRKTLLKSGVNY